MQIMLMLVVLCILVLSASCSTGRRTEVNRRDIYGETIRLITGPLLFPAEAPPQLDSVQLASVDGMEVLAVQHHDVNVVVCTSSPCGEGTRVLRTIVAGDDRTKFTVEYAELGQMPGPDPQLNEELQAFWGNVRFVDERPDWLTPDLYPTVLEE